MVGGAPCASSTRTTPRSTRRILIAAVAKLKNVTLDAFNREVLVHGTDEMIFRLQQNLKIGIVGNRAAACDRGQARAAPAAQQMIDGIVVHERAASPTTRAEPLGKHLDDAREVAPGEIPVRPRPPYRAVQLVFAPFARRDFSRNLLSEHVERL